MSSVVNVVSALLLLVAVIMLACREMKIGITMTTIAVLLVGLNVAFPQQQVVVMGGAAPTSQQGASRGARNVRAAVVTNPPKQATADVPANQYIPSKDGKPELPMPPVAPSAVQDTSRLLLPVNMEGKGNAAAEAKTASVVPSCGQPYKMVPNLPPMPGVAQFMGDSVWRLPEYPVDDACRGESLAPIVNDLPNCTEATPMETIRNKGLYGIKGNLSCSLLQRSAVADTGFLQPLGARNAFLAYNTYDQIHAKDPYMIPVINEVEQQRNYPNQ